MTQQPRGPRGHSLALRGTPSGVVTFVPQYQRALIAAPIHPPGSMRQSDDSARDGAVIFKARSKRAFALPAPKRPQDSK